MPCRVIKLQQECTEQREERLQARHESARVIQQQERAEQHRERMMGGASDLYFIIMPTNQSCRQHP